MNVHMPAWYMDKWLLVRKDTWHLTTGKYTFAYCKVACVLVVVFLGSLVLIAVQLRQLDAIIESHCAECFKSRESPCLCCVCVCNTLHTCRQMVVDRWMDRQKCATGFEILEECTCCSIINRMPRLLCSFIFQSTTV